MKIHPQATKGHLMVGTVPVIGNLPEPIFDSCNPSAPLNFLAINGDSDPFPHLRVEKSTPTPPNGFGGGWHLHRIAALR